MPGSFQQRRKRQRPLRVNLTYEVDVGGAIEKKELPFVVGVIADLAGDNAHGLPSLANRQFVEIRPDFFDRVLKHIRPGLSYDVDNKLEEGANARLTVELSFQEFADFSPERVAEQIAPLEKLLDKRRDLLDLKGKLAVNRKLIQELRTLSLDDDARAKLQREVSADDSELEMGNVPEQLDSEAVSSPAEAGLVEHLVGVARFGQDASSRAHGHQVISTFARFVLDGAVQDLGLGDPEGSINELIRQLDRLISAQLNEVMHHAKFQRLESAWRGLRYLVSQTETGPLLKIKVIPVTKDELFADLASGKAEMTVDRSELFRKVHSEELAVFGGSPYGALIGDFEFGHTGRDIRLLARLSQLAAAAYAPFIAAAHHEMFGLESFGELSGVYDLESAFESVHYAQWKAFRDSEESRYVVLTVPRMLAREPYGISTVPVSTFDYMEEIRGEEGEGYLWANGAWALGSCITRAFSEYGWCARIRGVTSGGRVELLPTHVFETAQGDVVMKCPTEVFIADNQEFELAKLGFAPLANEKYTANAVFFSVHSTHKPKEYGGEQGDALTASAFQSAQLPYVFALSRFAHYLIHLMLHSPGAYRTPDDLRAHLNNWISGYVLLSSGAAEDVKAKRPLGGARIEVERNPRKIGGYRAIAFLNPHFQLDPLDLPLQVVLDVPDIG